MFLCMLCLPVRACESPTEGPSSEFITFTNGWIFIYFAFDVLEKKAMYSFSNHSSFNPSRASITQIEKEKKVGLVFNKSMYCLWIVDTSFKTLKAGLMWGNPARLIKSYSLLFLTRQVI